MKPKDSSARESHDDDMRPEYDFSNATRGKYYRRYMESTNVVVLDPDVAKGFKNSEAVNRALRALLRVAQDSVEVVQPHARKPARRTT
jgi:hypothetical protein